MRLSLLSVGLVSPISESEIAQELVYRNYTTGQAPVAPPVSISRSDAIKAGVNRALDARGMARKASTVTYLDVMTISYIIQDAKNYANAYLDGSQTPSANLLSGIRGFGMKIVRKFPGFILRGIGQTTLPPVQPPPQPGFNGWALLLTLIGSGLQTYGNYLLLKNQMVGQGYSFPAMTGSSYEQNRQLLYQINPNLTQAQIDEILRPYQPQSETPTWVWFALGIGAVYVLTQRKTA